MPKITYIHLQNDRFKPFFSNYVPDWNAVNMKTALA